MEKPEKLPVFYQKPAAIYTGIAEQEVWNEKRKITEKYEKT